MAQALKVVLWMPFNLQAISRKGGFVIVLPTLREALVVDDMMSVCVLHKGVYKEVSKARVLKHRQVCLGGVMDMEWAIHIGPREKETYIDAVWEKYERKIDEYNFVTVLTLRSEWVCDELLTPLSQDR